MKGPISSLMPHLGLARSARSAAVPDGLRSAVTGLVDVVGDDDRKGTTVSDTEHRLSAAQESDLIAQPGRDHPPDAPVETGGRIRPCAGSNGNRAGAGGPDRARPAGDRATIDDIASSTTTAAVRQKLWRNARAATSCAAPSRSRNCSPLTRPPGRTSRQRSRRPARSARSGGAWPARARSRWRR